MVSFGIFWSGQWWPRGGVGSAHTTKRIFCVLGFCGWLKAPSSTTRVCCGREIKEISATIWSSEGGCGDGGLGRESGACVA